MADHEHLPSLESLRLEAHRQGVAYVAGDVAQELAELRHHLCWHEDLRHQICWHETGHAVVHLVQGDDPARLQIRVDAAGGVVGSGLAEGVVAQVPKESDDEKLDALNASVVACGFDPLDRAELRREAGSILAHHWTLVISIASALKQRLAAGDGTAQLTGDEIGWMWTFHQMRSEA